MALSLEQMRNYIMGRYGYAARWCDKVNAMPDNQVIAIYWRLIRERTKHA